MATTFDLASLEEKTREFCEFVVEQESFQDAWKDIETFLGDEEAKQAYRTWQEKASEMHRREHHHGLESTEDEVADLEQLKQAMMANAAAANFLGAESHMNRIFGTVTRLLQKTLQTGRVPSEDEMAESEGGCCGNHGSHGGGCGGGGGCH